MDNERVILGLDVGIGSIGWGLVKLKEEKYTVENKDGTTGEKYRIKGGEIINTGVRTFARPEDEKGKSLAAQRGQARRTRRTIRRKAGRLKQFIKLAKEFNLIGDNFNRDEVLKPKRGENKKEKWDIWRIRKEALERKLEDGEFFRVLYHIAKHRGTYFHTKAEFLPEKDKGKSNDKKREAEESEKEIEKEKVKQGIRRIQKMLKESGYKTIGQMFWEVFKQTNADNKRKRNAKDKYANSIRRELLRDEIEEIFKSQQKFKNPIAKDELKQKYTDEILMFEEGIDDERLQKTMSTCEFTGKLCAPKDSYTAERFTLFNRLNTLEIIDTNNKDSSLVPDDAQRKIIEELAYKNAKVTFAQIREELHEIKDKPNIRFNLCSYAEKNPEYNKKLKCDVKEGKLQFNENHKVSIIDIGTGEIKTIERQIKEIFLKRFKTNYNHVTLYYSDIRKELQKLEDFKISDFIFQKFEKDYTKPVEKCGGEAGYIKQFEKEDTFVELKGYHKIRNAIEKSDGNGRWDQLKGDVEKLDAIAEALTYCKSDETREDYLQEKGITDKNVIDAVLTIDMKKLANFSKEALTNILRYMESNKRMRFNEAKKACGYGKIDHKKQTILEPYKGFFEKNPVVARVISQTRKMINAIVRKYNVQFPIDQIHIEVASQLANSKQNKIEIAQGQKRYREERDAAEERCKELGIDPDEGQNLLMFRLAEQQRNKCPYTGKAITLYPAASNNEVYIKDCEIDHIIPMSRSFNDSMNNKVLCAPEANQNKRDRIPFEWFEEMYGRDSQEWSNFENTVKKMYGMTYPKRKNLLRKSWTEEDKEKFLSRNLNDTRYAARHIADYLRKYFDFTESEREDIKEVSRVKVRSGGITAFLRYMWGLSKDREENDLHHAIDALVVACSTDGHVYWISNLSKATERKEKDWVKHYKSIKSKFKPWPSVREDIENKVNNVFVSRMPRHKVTGGGHKDTIESLKEMPQNKRVIKINKGYADIGEMVRADIYTDGNGKNYVVPLYATDFAANKPLPDKYIPGKSLPYEKWPSVLEKNLKFKFSLFKDDLIEIDSEKYYVDFVGGTQTNISVRNIDGSKFKSTNDKMREFCCKNVKLKKYTVDMLGNYKEIEQEKRLGNNFENDAKKGL